MQRQERKAARQSNEACSYVFLLMLRRSVEENPQGTRSSMTSDECRAILIRDLGAAGATNDKSERLAQSGIDN
jgi:hypothetical protein